MAISRSCEIQSEFKDASDNLVRLYLRIFLKKEISGLEYNSLVGCLPNIKHEALDSTPLCPVKNGKQNHLKIA